MRNARIQLIVLASALSVSAWTAATGAGADDARELLVTIPPQQSAQQLQQRIAAGGEDQNDIFALGITQTLGAVEQLGRGMYGLGPRRDTLMQSLPILRIPVPEHPNPPVATLADAERVVQRFVDDLAVARRTLATIDGEVALSLPITQLALDFNGDGKSGEGERLGDVLFKLRMVNPRPDPAAAEFFVVDFDTADVQWLIAYTHLLSCFAEFMLAHDATELWNHAGHLLFRRTDSPFDFLKDQGRFNLTVESISDLAAFIHLLKLPVRDPERLERARHHFLAGIAGSRRMFELVRAETDEGREWIPNAQQKPAFAAVRVTEEIIDAWLAFLDDAEGVFKGERLIPFWRTDDGRGVNLRRALAESRELDAVLWVQGTAAVPYLERDKPLATGESFRRMQQATRGNFLTFAVWFN